MIDGVSKPSSTKQTGMLGDVARIVPLNAPPTPPGQLHCKESSVDYAVNNRPLSPALDACPFNQL